MAAVMVGAALVCLVCALRPGHPGWRLALPGAVVMAAAMIDAALLRAVPPVLWALALLIAAVVQGIALRGAGSALPALHRGLGLVLCAGLVLGAHAPQRAATGHTHGLGAGTLALLLGAAVIAVCALAVVIIVRHRPRRTEAVDVVAMSAMLAAMVLPAG